MKPSLQGLALLAVLPFVCVSLAAGQRRVKPKGMPQDFKTLHTELGADFAGKRYSASLEKAQALVSVIAKALEDFDTRVAYEAAWALASFREKAAPATSALVEALSHEEPLVRTTAAGALAAIGAKARASVPALLLNLLDTDGPTRRARGRSGSWAKTRARSGTSLSTRSSCRPTRNSSRCPRA